MHARYARVRRWEFWPRWLFYLPLLPFWVLLALKHWSATIWTAANTCMPHGGVVGERKSDILSRLPGWAVVPFELIDAAEGGARVAQFGRLVRERGWAFPLIAKPDVGERGEGFRLLLDFATAEAALREHSEALLIQPYHAGPFEAGVFYVRPPGSSRGKIFSITDKYFPRVIGDGYSNVRTLLWADARYRIQAGTFLSRLGPLAERVPRAGEPVALAAAGNHCQGTLFRDGSHLLTPALERAIDEIALRIEGFHFGRFDIRYENVEEFKRGERLAIIELNGVLSESTNIYDPSNSLFRAYLTLAKQWLLAFDIGAANARRGARVTGVLELLRAVRMHAARRVPRIAD